jgi:hypothetical protein
VEHHPSTRGGTLTEPYLQPKRILDAYKGQVPRAVELTYQDFNRGTEVDINNDTQDYQTRYSPESPAPMRAAPCGLCTGRARANAVRASTKSPPHSSAPS